MFTIFINSSLGQNVEYSNNHLVAFSLPELMTYSEPIIEPILYVDVAMSDKDLSLLSINPNELVYYYNYSYGGGDYKEDNFCVYDVQGYEKGLLPQDDIYPYKVTGILYKCFDEDDYQIIPVISGTSNFNLQAYSECDYSDYNLSLGETKIHNFTYIINYESNTNFFKNNGILESIAPDDFENPYPLTEIIDLNFNWLQYTQVYNENFYDSSSNCVESSEIKQEFIIPLNMTCVELGMDYLTFEEICLYEFNFPNKASYSTNFVKNINTGDISNINILIDQNKEYSDKTNLIKQQTTNIIQKASENNYLIIDFLITICEFLITFVLLLYYFILVMVIGFVFTFYIPKIIMVFPNMLYEIIKGKRGGR